LLWVDVWTWLLTLSTWLLTLVACDWTWVDTLLIWDWTLEACDWMLSMALLTLLTLSLLSLPHPAAMKAVKPPSAAIASPAAVALARRTFRLGLLD
jgi:hypothetical protein